MDRGPRILVAGSSGQVGSRVSALLAARGNEVVGASTANGIDILSGLGLDAAMAGVDVVIDVTNTRTSDAEEARRFFEAGSRRLLDAGHRHRVRHHLVLSVVGADRMTGSGYMRAKVAQERVVAGSGIPYTILRATQFFEFLSALADAFSVDGQVRVPDARMQPIAVDDVAISLAGLAVAAPVNGIIELGGPRAMPIRDAIASALDVRRDPRAVVADREVRYFGAELRDDTLLPAAGAMRGATELEDWLRATRPAPA